MVKLASARESRMYGPRRAGNRSECINAALYLFATVVLVGGFVAALLKEVRLGHVLLLTALALIILVNIHDLVAHLAGIDYQLRLTRFDTQLLLVEFAAPAVHAVGSVLLFLGILFLFLEEEKGYGDYKLGKHALNLLLAGTGLWVIGSIHNSCQIYERADVQVQILQLCVQIPFLMGSLLFLVGAILNCWLQSGTLHHGSELLGWSWVWLGISGSMLFLIGGLANVVKVIKMQQMDRVRLEKLRGVAQELIVQERECSVPLILEEQGRRQKQAEDALVVPNPTP